jgi:spore maturation protein A
MAMAIIWTGMVLVSILCGLATGRGPAVATAALDGAAAAVELCLSLAGVLCLWMGVMEIMRRSGLTQKLSRLLMPVLRRHNPAFAGTGR